MSCLNCESKRVASVSAKCEDLCRVTLDEAEVDGYVPEDMGIGDGDYIAFDYCLDCGQIQGDFPLGMTELELTGGDDEELEDE
jgi:hypothetical protein